MKRKGKILEPYSHNIYEIEQDHVHGSTFLANKSLETIISFSESYDFSDNTKEDVITDFALILSALINAQPQMGLIFTLANDSLYFLDDYDQNVPKESVISYLSEIKNNISSRTKQLSFHLRDIMRDNPKILTYSSSSSIITPLIQLHKEGIDFKVMCSESRPRNEGIFTAKSLAKHSIPVTLFTDSSLFSHITDADLVVLGADAISRKGVINKIGTNPIVTLAKQYDISCYIITDPRKILPYDHRIPEEQMKPADDIIHKKYPEKLSIHNVYFDYTPLDYFNYVVSEQGFLSIPRVKEYMMQKNIHNALCNVLSSP
jgi:translation initiation factor 2B subunit (eIF-2B alpha/beta/delta family)